jgi:hypothetical protein
MALINEKAADFKGMEVRARTLKIYPTETSTVTQATNRTTGVTINSTAGQITTDATSLAAGAEATFVVTNSHVSAKTVPVIAAASGQTTGTSIPAVTAVASGSFSITLTNLHASTADTGAMVINFVLINAN